MSKVCTKCQLEKPYAEFSKRTNSADGYTTECKACFNTRYARYRNTLRGHLVRLLSAAKRNSKVRQNRGRVAAAAITITTYDLEQIWISQDGRCYYSGIEMSYTTKDWLTSLERLATQGTMSRYVVWNSTHAPNGQLTRLWS